MGLSDTGFTATRAATYLALGIAQFKALTGVDLSQRPNNALYIILSIVAVFMDALGQVAQAVYDARSLNNATGVQLDNLGQIKGVPRKAASYSTVIVTLATTLGVPAGSQLADGPTGERWATTANANPATGTTTAGSATSITTDFDAIQDYTGYSVLLISGTGASTTPVTLTGNTNGPASVFTVAAWPGATPDTTTIWKLCAARVVAEPLDTGPIEGLAGTLTTIITPCTGWTAVTNGSDAVLGRDIELDTPYRIRIQTEQPNNGARSPAGLQSTLLALAGVDAATVLSNPADTTQTVQGVSMTPHSGAVVIWPNPVDDATKDLIVTAIYNQISFGIATIGDQSGTVIDKSGQPQTLHWKYATATTVNVVVVLAYTTGYTVLDVQDAVTAAVTTFIAGLTIGDSVYNLRVAEAIALALPTQITGAVVTLNAGTNVSIDGSHIAVIGTIGVT